MGWLISIVILVAGMTTGNEILLIAAGLFAISGSVSFVGNKIKESCKRSSEEGKCVEGSNTDEHC